MRLTFSGSKPTNKPMKFKIAMLALAAVVLTAGYSTAQTNLTETPNQLPKLAPSTAAWSFAKSFFLDNTNFWDQQTVIVGADVAYSSGHDVLDTSTTTKKSTFGGVVTVGFPLDENGQVSIGLWAAYFNSK